MRHQLTNKASAIVTFTFATFSLLTLFIACGTDEDGNGPTTTTPPPQTTQEAGAALGIKLFPYLKIPKDTLYKYFYQYPTTPPFRKLMLSFKIKDYTRVPDSLTLVAHGAKQNDELIGDVAIELDTATGTSPLPTDDLLYSTLELSDRKIKNLVESRPGEWKVFDYLVFIPYVETRNGQNYLSYHVQLRPIPTGASADQENTNPCPPFRPGEN